MIASLPEPKAGPHPRIDPSRLEPVREFRANPLGRHSAELTQMLSILRAGEVRGKYCLICIRPHAQWVIARLSGQYGIAPTVEDNRVFHSIEEAEWEVFKLRWAEECGIALDEDAL